MGQHWLDPMLQVFARVGTAVAIVCGLTTFAQSDDSCPAALVQATRLLFVTTPNMRSVVATLRRFERSAPGSAWQEIGKAIPAVVGKNGLGWGWTFDAYARSGEPVKHEGDMRAPAGFYPLGRPSA